MFKIGNQFGRLNRGQKRTEEQRKKYSLAKIGDKNPAKRPEVREKLRQLNLGKKHSFLTRLKISIAHKGRKITWKDKISKAKLGKKRPPRSEEWGKHIGGSHRGKKLHLVKKRNPPSQETKKKISQSKIGAKNPQWRGGISYYPYTTDWTRTLRRSIRERDHYCCRICGKEPAIHVHHINYDKKNCNSENLITLCRNCHTKTNSNREYWKNYFMGKQ